jgi:hypothetical protein
VHINDASLSLTYLSRYINIMKVLVLPSASTFFSLPTSHFKSALMFTTVMLWMKSNIQSAGRMKNVYQRLCLAEIASVPLSLFVQGGKVQADQTYKNLRCNDSPQLLAARSQMP